MDEIAARRQCPVSQVAINWCVQNQGVATALIGMTKTGHVAENCAAFTWKLTEAEMTRLNAAIDQTLKDE